MENVDKDLPLMANTDDVLVDHYVLNMEVDFSKKIFHCRVFLFLTPTDVPVLTVNSQHSRPQCRGKSEIILDCKDLEIVSVEEVILLACSTGDPATSSDGVADHAWIFNGPSSGDVVESSSATAVKFNNGGLQFLRKVQSLPRTPLKFLVEKWCIRIWKESSEPLTCDAGRDGISNSVIDENRNSVFPRAICVKYRTSALGTSVIWRLDQNGRECCFTPGSWINNRSLFPCQEPPIASATWQAFVKVPAGARVIMTSDLAPTEIEQDEASDHVTYCCSSTALKLPMSTLALAIGYWTPVNVSKESVLNSHCVAVNAGVKCRILAPGPSLIEKAIRELSFYLHRCLDAAVELLGPHPFPRLDLLLMPRCFDCLGLASPNAIFVSQSLLAGDGSMLAYVAHEITHSWFGLAIGASDWSEEWLSEGFATYVGDVVHARAMEWPDDVTKEWTELRAFLHYRTLATELKNTELDLQTLKPIKVDNNTTHCSTKDGTVVAFVKNGMNPDKSFTQVHYLKGFFLLRYLNSLVGYQNFNEFLRVYVRTYHGKLVDSQEVFRIFFKYFPDVRLVAQRTYSVWLPAKDKIITLRKIKEIV